MWNLTDDKLLIIFSFLGQATHSRQLKILHARIIMKGNVVTICKLFLTSPQSAFE